MAEREVCAASMSVGGTGRGGAVRELEGSFCPSSSFPADKLSCLELFAFNVKSNNKDQCISGSVKA